MNDDQALINYYMQHGYYTHVENLCEKILEKRGYDTTMVFWRAVSMGLGTSLSESIRELSPLQHKRDVKLPSIAALIYMHKKCKLIDNDEVTQLEGEMALMMLAPEDQPQSSLILCSTFYWHINKINEARTIVQAVQGRAETPVQIQATLLRGWIDITTSPNSHENLNYVNESIQFFKKIEDHDCVDVPLGFAKYYDTIKSYEKALKYMDKVIVKYPHFKPALSEKASLLMKMGDWEMCIDTAERALRNDNLDMEALRILIFYYLTQEGKVTIAVSYIKTLLKALRTKESSNTQLYYDFARGITRISDDHPDILRATLAFLQEGTSGEILAERGFIQSRLCDFTVALTSFKDAHSVDSTNTVALYGNVDVQIKRGLLKDASDQMEFLSVIQEDGKVPAAMLYLQAILAASDADKHMDLLQKAYQDHMSTFKEAIQSNNMSIYDTIHVMNPLFLMDLASQLLTHVGKQKSSTSAKEAVGRGISILEKIIKESPGLLRAQVTLSTAHLMLGDLETASQISTTILTLNDSNAEAHLLLARIALDREQYSSASGCLEEALSHDFSIGKRPVFHIIKAKVFEKKGELLAAKEVLEKALLSYKKTETDLHHSSRNSPSFQADNVSLHIQLSRVYSQLYNSSKATSILTEALKTYKGTCHEVRLLVANSELSITSGDFDGAIKVLNNISTDSPSFAQAQMVKANVYLTHRRDKILYAKCFEELVTLSPTSDSYIRLGEAYLRIQNHQDAIEAFSRALKLNPSDYKLASKIGKTLITMHNYDRAINYFENAMENSPDRISLRIELATLLSRLKQHENALETLNAAPIRKASDVNAAMEDVQIYRLKAKIARAMNNANEVVDALKLAQTAQKSVLDLIRGDSSSLLEQNEVMADICYDLSTSASKSNNSSQAMEYHYMSLKYDSTHEPSILALAKVHLKNGDTDDCQTQASTLLRLNPSHQEAAILLADLMFLKADYESAIHQFKELLNDRPDNFAALSRFIDMLRRAGKIEQAPAALEKAKNYNIKTKHLPGFHYCTGLLRWHENKVTDAINALNRARTDGEWGIYAWIKMVEIYLNPDKDNLWEETQMTHVSKEHLKTTKKLLENKPNLPRGLSSLQVMELEMKIDVLQAYALIASKSKESLEKACVSLLAILESDKEYVPALLGLSIAYMLLKQPSKARNQLKRIVTMVYDPSVGEEFETSYLLLADSYIENAKYDLAQKLCKRALQHNKSSGKAWTSLGLIMEKEASYQDAAESYEAAWKCEGETSAAVGFKLAYNYLKASRFVEAIEVGDKVLRHHPDYLVIQTEIMEKAYEGLRP